MEVTVQVMDHQMEAAAITSQPHLQNPNAQSLKAQKWD